MSAQENIHPDHKKKMDDTIAKIEKDGHSVYLVNTFAPKRAGDKWKTELLIRRKDGSKATQMVESIEDLSEDVYTPGFVGSDDESLEALSYWSSCVSLLNSVNTMVNNENKRAILNSLCSMVSAKVAQLTNPAGTSMAPFAMSTATVPAPAPVEVLPTAAEDEEEEHPVNASPSTEVSAPEVVSVGDGEEEADPDKKAVVDLTMEAKSNEVLKTAFHGLEADVKKFLEGGDLTDRLFDRAYGYYVSNGEMPYGTAKARDGDPWNWVSDRLMTDLGKVKESLEEPNASIFKTKTLTTQRMRELAGLAIKL
jgi:hypothetical protein